MYKNSGCHVGNIRNNPLSVFIQRILLGTSLCVVTGYTSSVFSEETYFNPALLSLGAQSGASDNNIPDLSRFDAGQQNPGTYRVDIYVNDVFVDSRDVKFINNGDVLNPVMTLADYQSLGVNINAVSALKQLSPDTLIQSINKYIPAASTTLQFAKQRLDISLPQLVIAQRSSGYVDPSTWDEGVTAGLLNYTVTGSNTFYRGSSAKQGNSRTLYANLRSGFNWDAWRLRNYSSFSQSQSSSQSATSDFNVISTYLQRDIKTVKGQLTLGQTSTPGDVFDSVSFKGAQLVSDEMMVPDSIRNFSPIVRGIAHSNAQVTVRQDGNIIYQTNVAPGAFAISDLNPSSMSGDLVVTVKESDGSERVFIQTYTSLAVMQREGQLKYALVTGQLKNDGGREPRFVQGTLIYGMPHDVTVYGGGLIAQQYSAVTGGVGVSLGEIGAVSVDVTHANTTLNEAGKSSGQSYRVRYSKSLEETGTTLNLAAYRYSTEGYYSFLDANTPLSEEENNQMSSSRRRSEYELSLSQALGNWGSMYVSATQRNYWHRPGMDRTYSLGYNGTISSISYGLNYSETSSSDASTSRQNDRRIALNISVPLSSFLSGNEQGYSPRSLQANYGFRTDQNHRTNQSLGLSGTALSDGQLSYNLSQNLENQGGGYGASLEGTFNGAKGTVSGGYNYSKTQQQLTYGVSGGVVAHSHGVTLSPPLGDTLAIIRAPGAGDMKVNGQMGLHTDWRGYAILPFLTPYRRTDISVDPSSLNYQVAMDNTSLPVIPTKGAVVLADYDTKIGQQALITLVHQGKPVPFGSMVTVLMKEENNTRSRKRKDNTSIVGDEGQVFMSGLPDKGQLQVSWGNDSSRQCTANFELSPSQNNTMAPAIINSPCQ